MSSLRLKSPLHRAAAERLRDDKEMTTTNNITTVANIDIQKFMAMSTTNNKENRLPSNTPSKQSLQDEKEQPTTVKSLHTVPSTVNPQQSSYGTPFDFLQYLQTHSQTPSVGEFIYLVRKPASHAYDLQIVRYTQIQQQSASSGHRADPDSVTPNYYTLSHTGLTHFYGSTVQHQSLQQWLHEYQLFHQMFQIPFFQRYRQYKQFKVWKQYTTYRRTHSAKKQLDGHLFSLQPTLQACLYTIQQLLFDVTQWQVFVFQYNAAVSNVSQPYTLNSYQSSSSDHLQSYVQQLHQIQQEICQSVSVACAEEMQSYLRDNGFVNDVSVEAEDKAATVAFNKSASINHATTTVPLTSGISHAQRAAMRHKSAQLVQFIRLVDQRLKHTLMTLLFDRVREYLQIVQDELKAKQGEIEERRATTQRYEPDSEATPSQLPLFTVDLVYNPANEQLEFDPTVTDFINVVDSSIEDTVQQLLCISSLHKHSEFQVYSQGQSQQVDDNQSDNDDDESHSTAAQILQNDTFNYLRSAIQQSLQQMFQGAVPYIQSLDSMRATYITDAQMNVEIKYSAAKVDEFSAALTQYELHIAEIQALPPHTTINGLHLNLRHLKQLWLPTTVENLHALERFIPTVAATRSRQLLERWKLQHSAISVIPVTVVEFIDLLTVFTTVNDASETDKHEYQYITDLYELIHEKNISIPESDRMIYYQLTQLRMTFQASIELVGTSISVNSAKFVQMLEEHIPETVNSMTDLGKELSEYEVLYDVQNASKERIFVVLDYLKATDKKLQALNEQCTKYKQWQQVLNTTLTTYDHLQYIDHLYITQQQLWSAVNAWLLMVNTLQLQQFMDVQVEQVQQRIDQHLAVCQAAESVLKNHTIITHLRTALSTINELLPIITELQCTALTHQHWLEIHTLVGTIVYHNAAQQTGVDRKAWSTTNPEISSAVSSSSTHTYAASIQQLLQCNISQHKQAINIIVHQAQQEQQLQSLLQRVIQTWNTLQFPLVPYVSPYNQLTNADATKQSQQSSASTTYIVGDVTDIENALTDTLSTLHTILTSPYVDSIRFTVEEYQRKLNLLKQVLSTFIKIQTLWTRYEASFSGTTDLTRSLTDTAHTFTNADKLYHEVLQSIQDESNCLSLLLHHTLNETLNTCYQHLQSVDTTLLQHLHQKRSTFQRFQKLSDTMLLQLLSQSKNVDVVNACVSDMFPGVQRLEFDDKDIVALVAASNSAQQRHAPSPQQAADRLVLLMPVKARGVVEVWLGAVEQAVNKALRQQLQTVLSTFDSLPLLALTRQNCSQTVQLATEVMFTQSIDKALQLTDEKEVTRALNATVADAEKHMLELNAALDSTPGSSPSATGRTLTERTKIMNMLSIRQQQRDIAQQLKAAEKSPAGKMWRRSLRYYHDESSSDVIAKWDTHEVTHSFEYVGNSFISGNLPLSDADENEVITTLQEKFKINAAAVSSPVARRLTRFL